MQEIIVDEGKIKCLISGKFRKETPEEYIRQEFCRILLDVYKYPKAQIEVEYPIKVGSADKRCDIAVFCDEEKSQDNILWIIETKKKDEKEGVEQLWSYMSATTAVFGTWTNGDGIKYYHKDSTKSNRYLELPDIPKYKESVDSIGKYQKTDLVRCTDLKGVFKRCNNYFFSNQGLTQDKRFSEILKILFCKIEDEKDLFNEKCVFYITPEEQKSEKGIANVRERISKLFEKVKIRFQEDNIFDVNDVIYLNDRCLYLNVVGLFREYADKHIRGIDFNPDLARVAKMNMVLNDDGHTGIFHFDSLTPFTQWPDKITTKIRKNKVDIIMTNPPFGKKCVIDDKKILEHYHLGHKWELGEDGRWVETKKVDDSRTPDILFIERCLELLKPGGRMAMVLPDGILGNNGLEYVRQYILDNSDIVAIIDCPVESFLPSTDTKTSLLVLKKKKSFGLPQTFDTFMAIAKTCGHDRRGKEIYIRDQDGECVTKDGMPIIDNDLSEITKRLIEHVTSFIGIY